jgi:hypothetical protein
MTEKVTPTGQPRWQELLASFLREQQFVPELPMSEVELYQAQPALSLDAALAWPDALLPGKMLSNPAAWENEALPAEWVHHARNTIWSAPFPCGLGLAPQFLQQIAPLMQNALGFFRTPLRQAVTSAQPTNDSPELIKCKLSTVSCELLSRIASARLAGDHRQVDTLLESFSTPPDEVFKQNERAAQRWLQGKHQEAEKVWQTLPADQPVIAFNQALAALQHGELATGQQLLNRAAQGFPTTSGWHHLAELYLAALAA